MTTVGFLIRCYMGQLTAGTALFLMGLFGLSRALPASYALGLPPIGYIHMLVIAALVSLLGALCIAASICKAHSLARKQFTCLQSPSSEPATFEFKNGPHYVERGPAPVHRGKVKCSGTQTLV